MFGTTLKNEGKHQQSQAGEINHREFEMYTFHADTLRQQAEESRKSTGGIKAEKSVELCETVKNQK